MEQVDRLRRLAAGSEVSLASWLATPIEAGQAQALLAEVRLRLRHGPLEANERFGLDLTALICGYWAGRDIQASYQNLAALPVTARERALLELCCGQLFIARRYEPAWRHLDRGFQMATHLLGAQDYFLVLKRHQLLRQLPLATTPKAAAALEALLEEARVIARLKAAGNPPRPADGRHRDTLD